MASETVRTFSRFFSKSKKHDLTFFRLLHTFSRTPAWTAGRESRELDGGASTSIVPHGVIGTVLGVAAGRPACACAEAALVMEDGYYQTAEMHRTGRVRASDARVTEPVSYTHLTLPTKRIV